MFDRSPVKQEIDGAGSVARPFQGFVDGGDAGIEVFLIQVF